MEKCIQHEKCVSFFSVVFVENFNCVAKSVVGCAQNTFVSPRKVSSAIARPKWKFKRLSKFSETRLKTHATSAARFVFSHSVHIQLLFRPSCSNITLCISFLNRHNMCLCTFLLLFCFLSTQSMYWIAIQPCGRCQLSSVYLPLICSFSYTDQCLHVGVCCATGLFLVTY
jgi:hypothetical protein